MVGVDEIAVRAAGAVGSCGGGAIRSALGAYDAPPLSMRLAAITLKGCLLLMPLLAALQWGLRSAVIVQRLRKEAGRQGRPKPLRSGEMLVPVLRRRLGASVSQLFSSYIRLAPTPNEELRRRLGASACARRVNHAFAVAASGAIAWLRCL